MTRALVAVLLLTLLAVPAAVAHGDGGDAKKARAGTVVSVDASAGTVTIRLRDAARLKPGDRVLVKARALAGRPHDVRRDEDDDDDRRGDDRSGRGRGGDGDDDRDGSSGPGGGDDD